MPQTRGRRRAGTTSGAATRAEQTLAPRPFIPKAAERGADEFVGRAWVLDQVVDWMDHGSERFFLLVAEPGWGKSSLSAWLLGSGRKPAEGAVRKRLDRVGDAWSAGHLCSATTTSTVTPNAFVRSIAAQLAHRYDAFASAFLERAAPGVYNVNVEAGDNRGRVVGILTREIIVQAEDAREVFDQTVRLPLTDVANADPDGEPIFLLVDGLDDAVTYKQPNIVDLVAGASDLPERVRFFLTSRRETRVLAAFPPSGDVRIVQAPDADTRAANDGDIRAYVEDRLASPAVKSWLQRTALAPEAFVDQVVERAEGNFLFAHFVLSSRPPEDGTAAAVPAGLETAYDEFLARVLPGVNAYGDDPTWSTAVRPVLGTLAVAVPAAPEKVLPRWLGEAGDVPTALRTVGQLTEWVDDGGGARRLYHRSLADFLISETLPPVAGEPRPNRFYVAPREWHRAIADYYLRAIEEEWGGDWSRCDAYGLRRLVPHLHALYATSDRAAERKELAGRLCDLALDVGFQEAQRSVLGDATATVEAIGLAMDVSAATEDPAETARRVDAVARSWEPEMRASAARAIAELSRSHPRVALDELKALLR